MVNSGIVIYYRFNFLMNELFLLHKNKICSFIASFIFLFLF